MKRKLLRISELDEKSDTYTMSAYLIAQLGKNFSESGGTEITGGKREGRRGRDTAAGKRWIGYMRI